MKRENGITLTSIIIYIIALLIVVGVISSLTNYFYKNININQNNNLTNEQFIKFNSYFTSEINQEGIKVIESGENANSTFITFSNKQTYTYSKENKSIFLNEMKLCESIDNCAFAYEQQEKRYKITVNFKAGNFERTTTYYTKQ